MYEQPIPQDVYLAATQIYTREGAQAAVKYLRSRGVLLTPNAFRLRMRRAGIRSGLPRGGQNPWTDHDLALLADLWPDARVPGDVLTTRLGRSYDSIKVKAHELRLTRRVPQSLMPLATLRVPRIEVVRPHIVLADLHVPFHDGEWINRVLALGRAWGAETASIVGDFQDAQALAAKYETFDSPTTEMEVAEWRIVEEALTDSVPLIHVTLGNHESRHGTLLKHKRPLVEVIRDTFIQNTEQVILHDAFAQWVGEDWYLEHPKAHSDKVAIDLAIHHHANVIAAHTHHTSVNRDPSGKYRAIRVGAAADHGRMPYCSRITYGKYRMTQGAVILVPRTDGKLQPYVLEPDDDLEKLHSLYGRRYRKYV